MKPLPLLRGCRRHFSPFHPYPSAEGLELLRGFESSAPPSQQHEYKTGCQQDATSASQSRRHESKQHIYKATCNTAKKIISCPLSNVHPSAVAPSSTRLYLAEQEAYIERARHEQKVSTGPIRGVGIGSPLKPQPWVFWGENRRTSCSSSCAGGAVTAGTAAPCKGPLSSLGFATTAHCLGGRHH